MQRKQSDGKEKLPFNAILAFPSSLCFDGCKAMKIIVRQFLFYVYLGKKQGEINPRETLFKERLFLRFDSRNNKVFKEKMGKAKRIHKNNSHRLEKCDKVCAPCVVFLEWK